MNISGPFKDPVKVGRPKQWYSSYFAPKFNADGSIVVGENGVPVLKRLRPCYETKAKTDWARSGTGATSSHVEELLSPPLVSATLTL